MDSTTTEEKETRKKYSPAEKTDTGSKALKLPDAAWMSIIVGWLVMWGLFIWQLRLHWGGESYYSFGWFVPFAAGYLAYRRFQDDCPRLETSPSRFNFAVIIVMVLVLFLIPLRLLSEVNPMWRIPFNLQGLLMIFGTLVLTWGLGGRRFLLHFSFPIIFLVTMLPWPFRIELYIIQSFTEKVVEFSVQILHFLGYPAVVHGNTIHVGDQSVGVDDACSGIRSFQALGMAALFLGDLFRMSIWRRVVLCILAAGVTFIFNSLRSLALTLIVLKSGHEAYEEWHDPVGTITFIISILVIFGLTELVNIGAKGIKDASNKAKPPAFNPPKWAFVGLPLCVLLCGLIVEGWFRYKEMKVEVPPQWTIQWPQESEDGFEMHPIPEIIESALGYDYGFHGVFRMGNFQTASMYYYGYTGGDPIATVSSYGHSPLICMGAVGAELIRTESPLVIEKGEIEMSLQHFLFNVKQNDRNYVQNIFYVVWEDRNMGIDPERLQFLDYGLQFELVAAGRRDYSRKVLLISVPGANTAETARRTVRELLDNVLREGEGSEISPS